MPHHELGAETLFCAGAMILISSPRLPRQGTTKSVAPAQTGGENHMTDHPSF
jgi:hypothetical protein